MNLAPAAFKICKLVFLATHGSKDGWYYKDRHRKTSFIAKLYAFLHTASYLQFAYSNFLRQIEPKCDRQFLNLKVTITENSFGDMITLTPRKALQMLKKDFETQWLVSSSIHSLFNLKAKSKHKSNFQSLQHLKENLTSTAVPWQSNEETKNEEKKDMFPWIVCLLWAQFCSHGFIILNKFFNTKSHII